MAHLPLRARRDNIKHDHSMCIQEAIGDDFGIQYQRPEQTGIPNETVMITREDRNGSLKNPTRKPATAMKIIENRTPRV